MNANFYTAPSVMTGGYTVYGGYRRQRGGGMFGSFRKMMAPVAKQTMKGIKSIAKNKTVQKIAKKAAQKSAEVLTGVAIDALSGRDIDTSFRERARDAALQSLGATPTVESTSPKRAVRKLKQKKRSHSTMKRSPPTKIVGQPPAKKRRRQKSKTLSRAALNRKNLF